MDLLHDIVDKGLYGNDYVVSAYLIEEARKLIYGVASTD